MVVGDFHLRGIACRPSKADAPLIVDTDAHLSGTISSQRLKPIAWWFTQVIQGFCCIQLAKLAQCPIVCRPEIFDSNDLAKCLQSLCN
jgi:hypothetical protein